MHFDEMAMTWDTQKRWERAQLLSAAIKDSWGGTPKAVLDFGCGTGLLTFALAPYAGAVYGYDTSTEMQRVFQEKQNSDPSKNVQFVTAEAMESMAYDVIFSSMVLHHIPNINATISGLKRLLAPNGIFLWIDLDTEDGTFHKNEPDFRGHNGFSRHEVQRTLQNCGFSEVNIKNVYEGEKAIDGKPMAYSLFLAAAR